VSSRDQHRLNHHLGFIQNDFYQLGIAEFGERACSFGLGLHLLREKRRGDFQIVLRPLVANFFDDRGTVLLEILSKGIQEILAVPVAGSFRVWTA
jgi:hypothetical protein